MRSILLPLVWLLGLAAWPLGRPVHAQSAGSPPALWQPAPASAPTTGSARLPDPVAWFRLDTAQLAARLAAAPAETAPAAAVTLEVPYPDGSQHRFALVRVSAMAPALAARYPQLRAYAGRGLDEPTATVRLETSPAGLCARVLRVGGAFRVEPDPAATGRYQSRPEAPAAAFDCQALALPAVAPTTGPLGTYPPPDPPAPYGTQRRTLRLAMAATNGFVQHLGGGTVAGTLATMNTLVNELNAVYERDLAVRLELVANNDLLIFVAPDDPYGTESPSGLYGANITVLNAHLPGGPAAYDLGHVLGFNGGGGYAYVGVVCYGSPLTAGGASSTGYLGTAGDLGGLVRIATHELGHQFGSGHTFNGTQGNCGNFGQRFPLTAFEPGAGTTIMSYPGLCGGSDDVGGLEIYFHAGSLSAIVPHLSCGTLTPTGNHVPSLSVPPSNTYTIPIGTPFALAGTGTDADGDALLYAWEELDTGNASGLAGAATDASGPPLFRSPDLDPSPVRTFPTLAAVLSGTSSLGEILPQVPRSLTFRLTARDGRGGVAGANVTLAVAASGPFRVTAPASSFTAAPGSACPVSWDVNGTDQPPVGCAAVQILFSADGGATFPTVLRASAPNTGSALVTLPTTLNTTQGRLKVQALGNVFFAVSPAVITLTGPISPLPVELTAFTATAGPAGAHLAWSTATEHDNAGFAIETAADGSAFRRLGWVAGAGSSASPRHYGFDDAGLAAAPGPVAYYRLRQVDQDGTETFSPVRAVPVPAGAGLQVWPSPARHALTVAGLAAGQLVQVLDLTGRVLLAAPVPARGPLQLALPAELRAGLYLVRGGGQARRLLVE